MISDDDAFARRAGKPIDLALQGGGSHGALTWGVLDRLLADGRLRVGAVSGTSAGAMNAVVLADGFARGGPEGAQVALAAFWRAVSDAARMSPMRRGVWDRLRGRYSLDGSPGYLLLEGLARLASPYALNPLGLNPLREILERQIDFERVRSGPIAVHVAATNVRSGQPEIFSGARLTVDAVMASACLPQFYAAVEIDGEAYWDGGFTANPALLPLVENRASQDILIVQINPARREALPTSARAIANRMNEIGFNASLVKELGALAWMQRRGAEDVRLHRIAGAEGEDLAASSKLDAEWAYLSLLFERGREAAGRWLEAHFEQVGVAGTLELDLDPVGPGRAAAVRQRGWRPRWLGGGAARGRA